MKIASSLVRGLVRAAIAAGVTLASLAAAGCGQKGPLSLPTAASAPAR